MVAFDGLGGLGSRFDDVRIQSSLPEEGEMPEAGGFFLENGDEFGADELPFAFGFGDALEAGKEPRGGIDPDEGDPEGQAEEFVHFLGFVLPQEAVVDEDAGEAVAEGFVEEEGGDAGIHAPGNPHQDGFVPHEGTDAGDLFFDVPRHRPRRLGPAEIEGETPQDVGPVDGMLDFGVELDAEPRFLAVLDGGGHPGIGEGDDLEPFGRLRDPIPMAHPDFLDFGKAGQKPRIAQGPDGLPAVFPGGRGFHLAVAVFRHPLHPVTDPEDGDSEIEDAGVAGKGFGFVDGMGSSGKNEALEAGTFPEVSGGDVEGAEFAVDAEFPEAADDQLVVLAPEIEHEDFVHSGSPSDPVSRITVSYSWGLPG